MTRHDLILSLTQASSALQSAHSAALDRGLVELAASIEADGRRIAQRIADAVRDGRRRMAGGSEVCS